MAEQIANNIIDKLYGSLIAVLNLITDNAPTRPRDKANDVFTTAIKDATLIVKINIVFPKEALEVKVIENLLYKNLIYNPIIKEANNIVSPSKKFNCIEDIDKFVFKISDVIPSIKNLNNI
tara:strand:+ start:705 stop:1067 length:363 start_codon:yes stop_codon:yes gene_type:complete